MEVLISMFVMAFGLLGVAAVIPAGGSVLQNVNRADRCGSVGRGALREIKSRRLLQPAAFSGTVLPGWVAPNGTPAAPPSALCIDPLLIASAYDRGQTPPRGVLENLAAFPARRVAALGWPSLTMPRVTYPSGLPKPQPPVMPTSVAERIFAWRDDLAFDAPGGQGRPRQLFRFSGGEVCAWPFRSDGAAPPGGFAVSREIEGNYTWMITAVPVGPAASPGGRQLYNVAVVVFYKRDLREPNPDDDEPTERLAIIRRAVLGRGMGGGTVALDFSIAPQGARQAAVGDWLLLGGSEPPAAGVQGAAQSFAWYKVVAAGAAQGEQQEVSISGPDWPCRGATPPPLQAVLLRNVLGVYTSTLQVDFSSLWGR